METIIQVIPFTLGRGDLPWIQLHEGAKMFLKTLLACRVQGMKGNLSRFSPSQSPQNLATLTSIPVLQGQAYFNNLDAQLIVEVSHA